MLNIPSITIPSITTREMSLGEFQHYESVVNKELIKFTLPELNTFKQKLTEDTRKTLRQSLWKNGFMTICPISEAGIANLKKIPNFQIEKSGEVCNLFPLSINIPAWQQIAEVTSDILGIKLSIENPTMVASNDNSFHVDSLCKFTALIPIHGKPTEYIPIINAPTYLKQMDIEDEVNITDADLIEQDITENKVQLYTLLTENLTIIVGAASYNNMREGNTLIPLIHRAPPSTPEELLERRTLALELHDD